MIINSCTNFIINFYLFPWPSLCTWDVEFLAIELILYWRQNFSFIYRLFIFEIIEFFYAIGNVYLETCKTIWASTNVTNEGFWLSLFYHCKVLTFFGLFFFLNLFMLSKNFHLPFIQRRRPFYLFKRILLTKLDMFCKRLLKECSLTNIAGLKGLLVENFRYNLVVKSYLFWRPLWSWLNVVFFTFEFFRKLSKLFLLILVFLSLLILELLCARFEVDLQWGCPKLPSANVAH